MTIATSSIQQIEKLKAKLETDSDLANLLAESLQKAKAIANAELNRDLFEALCWPADIRFHTPVAGLLRECRTVNGLVYLDVNLANNQFDAPDSSEGGYEFAQARGIAILDTTESAFGDVGIVGVVPVGMCQVSSVNMTAAAGNNMLKGDEFGYFLFGGSDIIILFQEGTNPQIYTGKQYRYYGTTIATCDKR